MGIQGLLPLLKEIQQQRSIADFKGKKLAIDGYVWLHKGAFGCAEALVKGERTTKFVDYAMFRIRMLRHHGITPLVVLDGGPLPAKKGTEVDRARRRADSLAKAHALAAQGRAKEAREIYTKCVDVTPEMALQLIKALRAESVEYIVAPYEADAQLAYLEREGLVDGIITEDSDLLVFGCKTVIYRLDGNGDCMTIERSRFGAVRSFNFTGWTDTEFRRMAILAGCDYLDSIHGIGIKKAHALLRKHKTVEKVIMTIRMEGSLDVPNDYIASFQLAELVFLHQRVYDPAAKRLVTLLPLPDGGLDEIKCRYIGQDLPAHVAQGLAEGRLHPESYERLDDLWPDFQPVPRGVVPAVQSRAPLGSKVLTPSNTQRKAGPLDAFLSSKRRKAAVRDVRLTSSHAETPVSKSVKANPPTSAPAAFVPKPVGVRGSGPARLSDLSSTRTPEILRRPPVNSEGRRSKFFKSPGQARQTLRDELVFDDGLTVLSAKAADLAQRETSPVSNAISPPHSASAAALDSPTSSDYERARQGSAFTSPDKDGVTAQPTSPDCLSSPTKLSNNLDKRSIPVSPSAKPSAEKRQRMLLSPDELTSITSSCMLPGARQDSASDAADWDSSSVHEDLPAKEEVVTPVAEHIEAEEAAIVIERKDNDEAAKRIGQAWKAKWSFDAQLSTLSAFKRPGSAGSTRKPLAPRSVNPPTAQTPTPVGRPLKSSKTKASAPVSKPVQVEPPLITKDAPARKLVPLGPTVSGSQKLQRFKFAGALPSSPFSD